MVLVTLYSRPGCHLCDEMKAVVRRVAETIALRLEEVDISCDADLERRYGQDIPVLVIAGTKAAKHRVTEAELARILRARRPSPGNVDSRPR